MGRLMLYPLRFEPIYQYRPWGGRRLASLLTAPLPGDGPIGEAWYSATAMTIKAWLPTGRSKGRLSLNCWRNFPNR